jgi:hypothetical protein
MGVALTGARRLRSSRIAKTGDLHASMLPVAPPDGLGNAAEPASAAAAFATPAPGDDAAPQAGALCMSGGSVGVGLLDRAAVQEVLDRLRCLFEGAAKDLRVNQSGVLHVVVLDPALDPAKAEFDAAILYEASFGKPCAEWDFDYGQAARNKAKLSWRQGCDSHPLQTLQPQRLQRGDTLLWGSVCIDGIVVAVSGAHAAYDEGLSGAVAMLLRAEAKRRWQQMSAAGATAFGLAG